MKDSVQAVGHVTLKKGSAQAGGIIQVERVQTGTVIEEDVFLTGENPTLEGTVNGGGLVLVRRISDWLQCCLFCA